MLLVIDIGNTNAVLGLYAGEVLQHHFRVESARGRTSDEYAATIHTLLAMKGVRPGDVRASAIACVVPALQEVFVRVVRDAFGHDPLVIGPGIKTGMAIQYEQPREVGADRIVNAVAAFTRFGGPVIVVDLGTATTLDCVNAQGEFVGGVIAPGLRISAEALVARTSKLPRVEVARPKQHIGANTVEAMQSGLFYGYLGLVDRLARDCKRELAPPDGRGVRCVATGGFSHLVARSCEEIDEIDPDLTLRGLSRLYRLNRGEDRERPPG